MPISHKQLPQAAPTQAAPTQAAPTQAAPTTHKGSPVGALVHNVETGRSGRGYPRHREAVDITQVGDAIRSARKRRRMSQRTYALHLGINRARLARLEVDAGHQPLELVAEVLASSGFRLTLRRMDDGSDPDDPADPDAPCNPDALSNPDAPRNPDALSDPGASGYGPPPHFDLFDAAGRHFPAHCDPYRLSSPHPWWYVRNGGWVTRAVPPTWSYECPARSTPRRRRLGS
jgi:ribosome-binding protein aMBF1 (putative translation factor)